MVRLPDNPDQFDHIIGNLLLIGVVVSSLVAAAGGILYISNYGSAPAEYGIFHGEPADLRDVGGILSLASSFDSRGIIQLGLLLLIATPIARVILSVVAFTLERDYLYVGITLIVLAILAFSLFGGNL